MNKEFVTIEIAKELRNIGFVEPCITCYDGSDMLSTYSTVFKPLNYNVGGATTTSAPLYQQVFRWFREKHNLTHRINPPFNDVLWDIAIFKIGKFSCEYSESNFNSYEEAELTCLKKLIEIVKNENT